jgi:hypothetical protein
MLALSPNAGPVQLSRVVLLLWVLSAVGSVGTACRRSEPAPPAVAPVEAAAPQPAILELRASAQGYSFEQAEVDVGTVLTVFNDDPKELHTFHLWSAGESGPGPSGSIQNLAVPPGHPPLHWTLDRAGTMEVRSEQNPGWVARITVGPPQGAQSELLPR